jgi:hypothetical protein
MKNYKLPSKHAVEIKTGPLMPWRRMAVYVTQLSAVGHADRLVASYTARELPCAARVVSVPA